MHIIDCQWTELAAGYQPVQALQTRLEAEFGRAIQAGHKQKFRRELTEWQKKRRVFFALAAIAPLSILTLFLTAFYFREVACVIVYWAVVVLTILITLAVAGRSYIREAVNRLEPGAAPGRTADLEDRWWASLAPRELVAILYKGDELSYTIFQKQEHQAEVVTSKEVEHQRKPYKPGPNHPWYHFPDSPK